MKAVVLKSINDKVDDLALINLPIPELKLATDVLIKISYASINPIDYKLANNHFATWKYPYVIGLDTSGEVVAIGSQCTNLAIGDRVAVHGNLTVGGGLAEYAVYPEHVLIKLSENYSLAPAAALPCAGLTAYQALVRKMNIQAKRTIFINGGSGGVGSYAILIAKKLGLFVVATCSTSKIDYVKTFGADVIIDYTKQDVYNEIMDKFSDGVDYILETTTKENLQQDLSILAFNGQIASIVGIINTQNIQEFTTGFGFHEIALGGAYLANHYLSQCDLSKMGGELVEVLDSNQPRINLYGFDEYEKAFADLITNKVMGKVVIKVSNE